MLLRFSRRLFSARLLLCLLAAGAASPALSVPPAQVPAPAAGEPPRPRDREAPQPVDREERRRIAAARQKRERARQEQRLRRTMASLGFTDRALQDEVLRAIADETKERDGVRRKANELLRGLRDKNKTDEEVRILLERYQNALAADRTRRKISEDNLNARVGWRDKPRLEAMLVLFGVVGDSPVSVPARPRRFG